ncbi:MAG TPA: hypothetical protein VGM58_08940, partial [Verrucomicrobiae bacterium]
MQPIHTIAYEENYFASIDSMRRSTLRLSHNNAHQFCTGETIIAVSHPFRLISATMPDGEVLKGTYSAIDNSSISTSFGSATAFGGGTSATAFGSGTSYNVGGRGTVYAILKSTKPGSKLMLEIYANFSPMTTHG